LIIEKIPTHVAIIMDGNGRWARSKGLPRTEGHKAGTEVAEKTIRWAYELGIKYLTLYTFSTENWKRPREEVNFLFDLFADFVTRKIPEVKKEGVRLRFIGRLEQLPEKVLKVCKVAEEETKGNSNINVQVALNYGGRAELCDTISRIIEDFKKGKVDLPITEETVSKYLYTADIPDPDLIVRTANEKRLSNFLIWQAAYAEYYFVDKFWPDFSKEDLVAAVEEYNKRIRKFGAVIENE
jgi:undecaprenyl diphosphate synthase